MTNEGKMNQVLAALAGILLASLMIAPAATANASTDCTSAGPSCCKDDSGWTQDHSMECTYTCMKDYGTSVGASAQSAVYVQGGATCKIEATSEAGPTASCDGTGSCSKSSDDVSAKDYSGRCTGWADDGDGDVMCSGGQSTAAVQQVLAQMLSGGGNSCNGNLFSSLGFKSLAMVAISQNLFIQQTSFIWSEGFGCQHVLPVCGHDLLTVGGQARDGFRCTVG